MTYVHNVIIRGLNAIVQQAPYVKAYNKKDVEDLFFYVSSWVKMVEHHHWTEESFIFPEIEKFSGKPGSMDDPKYQHKLFHGGLERLLAYTQVTNPQNYRWDEPGGMKEIVDSFSKDLMDHLYAEVDIFLAMKGLDSTGLRKIWDQGEAIAKKAGNLSMLVSYSINRPEKADRR
jgi:hemerythrin superfamily protein